MSRLHLIRETVALRAWALAKIRLISYARPRGVELTEERCEIAVPLSWRKRNHLRSHVARACAGSAPCGRTGEQLGRMRPRSPA
ncbi:MAG TPA: hypothetical protein VJ776_01025 [Thermoanaerobaculia bacterium]|nr:hypothetical protein [Thermoanaerobaculia bacterium]